MTDNKDIKSVLLGVVALPFVYTGWAEWMIQAAARKEFDSYLTFDLGRYGESVSTAEQRNRLVWKALNFTDASHFIFLDWDTLPLKPNAFAKLIAHDKDIIGGVYFSKDRFDEPLVFKKLEQGETSRFKDYKPYLGKGLEEVDIISAGFSIIKRQVFEKMTGTWFYTQTGDSTDDVNFCLEAKRKGFKIYCDFDEVAEHCGVFSNRDKKWKDNKEFIKNL